MDLTIFLTQVIGLYLILIGVIFLARRKVMMAVMADIIKNKPLIYVVAISELLAGLALVVGHNVWAWDIFVVITIVGWLMVVEALIYLILPYSLISKIFKKINTPSVYIVGGILSVILGAYMAGIGFGVI